MLVPEKVGYKTKKILLELGTFHSAKRVNMSGRYSTCESTLTQDGFPGGSAGKNSPAMQEMQETWFLSLGWEGICWRRVS